MKNRLTIGIDEVSRAAPKGRASPNRRISIGIDEVGRGALAGPVVLGAVRLVGRIRWAHPELGRIRDSKKLTPKRREAWFDYLTAHPAIVWQVSRVSSPVIDRINIARAANLAAYRLVRRITPAGERSFAWLDGGLTLPPHVPHRALIRGDERVPIIAAASIIAKVWRDRCMARLAETLPRYGFEIHKGYGTKLHQKAIRRYGFSPLHRRSFLKRFGNY